MIVKPFRENEIFEAMARLLDVEYLYGEKGEEATQTEVLKLTAEMLADLPPELLQDLDKTAIVGNIDAILEVIGRIVDHAPETAEGLRELVYNYKIVELRDLLGEAD